MTVTLVNVLKEEWQIKDELNHLADKLSAMNCALRPIKEQKVIDWEKLWGVELPATYRRFITEIADGVVLPRTTVVPLEKSMTTARGSNWLPSQLPPDFLQKPFLYERDFNPDSMPNYEKIVGRMSDEEYSMWWLQHLHGTNLVADFGNDKSLFLIVSGNSHGQVWADYSAVGRGYERCDWDFLDFILRFVV